MSSNPPAPPPPPPPTSLNLDLPNYSPPSYKNSSPYVDQDICKWETKYPDLWEACAKYRLCLQEDPFKYKYKQVNPIIQVGPTCGLVALSMLINGDVSPDEILSISKQEGYTSNGEMLSCKNMLKLADKVLNLAEIQNVKFDLKTGGLFDDGIIKKLLNGACLLVPYDADCNHSPCLKQGHTAHWALVCGVLLIRDPGACYTSDPTNTYVFARHGKSRFVAAWRLDELERSNKNLKQFSPKKETDGMLYVMPEGGLGGENGLRDQFLIFEGL
ncbi:hypothetical protein O0L34_g635 [Tuta absoluta]|nr:hypothetical protein O0L34_g635 [Tuta absoluta]